jgi:hypothetical protein
MEHRTRSVGSPHERTDPEYVATAVGMLATGALVFDTSVTRSGPTVDGVVLTVLGVTLPATITYAFARRWG